MTTLDVGGVRRAVLTIGLAALSSVAWSQAQSQGTSRRITGHVLDADGKAPIPAATVRVANSTFGAATSDSGAFALRAPDGPLTLTVRRIGYTSATVAVAADQNDVTISLTRDVLKLDAEVITGVATTISSKNSANDVAVLNADQISSVPAPTIENALQGKIAGAVIQQNNGGAPGGGMQVQLRRRAAVCGRWRDREQRDREQRRERDQRRREQHDHPVEPGQQPEPDRRLEPQ
jgi:hypothetical protein